MGEDVFHAGERRAQALAGFAVKGAPIRDFMTDQHRVFFGQLPILFVGVGDDRGWPVATVVTGAPGFVSSPDAVTLRVGAGLAAADWGVVREGAGIGLLGLEFATRRRNRANGVVSAVMSEAFFVEVRQSFGNCPQYIQTRAPVAAGGAAGEVEALAGLEAVREMIEGADTLFVASRAEGEQGGFDVSHRGGRPGFVGIEGDALVIPDYRGNRYFNTFGNLLADERAGLLFVDFETGDLLQVQGRAAISWGEERVLRVAVTRASLRRAALPVRWQLESYAPELVG